MHVAPFAFELTSTFQQGDRTIVQRVTGRMALADDLNEAQITLAFDVEGASFELTGTYRDGHLTGETPAWLEEAFYGFYFRHYDGVARTAVMPPDLVMPCGASQDWGNVLPQRKRSSIAFRSPPSTQRKAKRSMIAFAAATHQVLGTSVGITCHGQQQQAGAVLRR